MLIAQLTDLHIRPQGKLLYDHIDTNALCARHIAMLNNLQQKPDLVVITGDITNCGLPAEYAAAVTLLHRLDYPCYIIPGNHDNNRNFLTHFAPHYPLLGEQPDAIAFLIDDYPVRLIFLDSSEESEIHGRLGTYQLEWLQQTLYHCSEKPTAIFMHHPPVATGCAHMDTIRCLDGEHLLSLLKEYPFVERLICGHTHRAMFLQRDNLLICTAPSCAHQVPVDVEDTNGFYNLEPPSMLMHRYDKELGFVSYVNSLAVFDGPFRFDTSFGCPEIREA